MRKDRAFAGSDWKNRDIRRVGPSAQPLSCPVPVRQINAGLLLITLILVCFGLVMLFSASMTDAYAKSGNALFYVIKQAGITGAGLLAALFIALMLPIRLFDHFWMTLAAYGVTTALLVYVKFFGILMNALMP